MIIWQNTEVFPKDLERDLIRVAQQPDFFDSNFNIYTTYNKLLPSELNEQIVNFYAPIVQKITKELNLFDRCSYIWDCWFQYYTQSNSHHEPHDHFQGHTILSWVHFIKTSRSPCFHFLKNQKPEKIQEEYDSSLIVFPAWALHAVLPCLEKEETRLVAAGNISLLMLTGGGASSHISRFTDDNTLLWSQVR